MRTAFALLLLAAIPAVAQNGRVEGRVVTVDGKPIPKATVRLTSRNSTANSNPVPLAYVEVTSADGRFIVENVPAGTYSINAQCPGYSVPNSMALRPVPVVVASGETRGGVEVKLVPFAVVSGIVTDADGDPVAGVMVRLLRPSYNQGRMTFQPSSTASTDDRGQFRLSNVTEGRYYLVVNGNATSPAGAVNEIRGRSALESNQTTYYPNSPTIEGAAKLDVKPGALESLQVRLRRGVNSSIKGTIEMPGGVPVVAQVQVLSKGADASGQNLPAFVRGPGQFETGGLSPGQYMIFARYNAPTTPGPPGTPLVQGKLFAGRVDVTVGTAAVENVSIRLTEAGEINGHMTMEGGGSLALNLPSIPVVTRVGTPPSNVPPPPRMPNVVLQSVDGVSSSFQAQVAVDGTFHIQNVIPMKYSLNVNLLPPGSYLKSARLAGQDVTTSFVDLSSGTSGPLEILLSPNAATLTIAAPSPAAQGLQGSVWPARCPTENIVVLVLNAQGSSQVPNVAPGDYYAVAWEDSPPGDFARIPEFLARFKDSAAKVTLKEGETGSVEPKVISRDAMQKILDEF